MKYLALVICLLFPTVTIFAQQSEEQTRFIEVIGYAEKEIVPNEIYYLIELQEYLKGKEKVSLKSLEQKLTRIMSFQGISTDNIELGHSQNQKIRINRKQEGSFRSKEYLVKFEDLDKLEKFAEKLVTIPVEQAGIKKVNHSDFQEIEQTLIIEAVKNAKSRANKLLKAIDAKLGKVVEISEVLENDFKNYLTRSYYHYESFLSQSRYGELSPNALKKSKFVKEKLTTTIRVKFEIE